MNNVTFGDERVGYYETVAGGAGAVRMSLHSSLCKYVIYSRVINEHCRGPRGMDKVEYTLT